MPGLTSNYFPFPFNCCQHQRLRLAGWFLRFHWASQFAIKLGSRRTGRSMKRQTFLITVDIPGDIVAIIWLLWSMNVAFQFSCMCKFRQMSSSHEKNWIQSKCFRKICFATQLKFSCLHSKLWSLHKGLTILFNAIYASSAFLVLMNLRKQQ